MAGNSPDISDMGEGDKKPTLLDRAGAAAAQAAGQVCSSKIQHMRRRQGCDHQTSHDTVALQLQAGRALAGRPPSCGPTGCGGDPRYQVHADSENQAWPVSATDERRATDRQNKMIAIMRENLRRQAVIAAGRDLHCRVQSIRCRCRPRVSLETRASEARVCSLIAHSPQYGLFCAVQYRLGVTPDLLI
jgi:hypothetical protein